MRIWLEPRESKNAAPIWHGVIEHVTSGTKRHVVELDQVTAFLSLYLNAMVARAEAK